jgi:transcriptional regulator with XRE-family HTH domain
VLSFASKTLAHLWQKFANAEYRHAFVKSILATTIAAQIETMRTDRKWTQNQLADAAGIRPPQISALEDPSNEIPDIETLLKIARANDVALSIKFVPFSRLAEWATQPYTSGFFSVPSFENDSIEKPH